ncbi:MAG TPA: cytochrome c oxidase subunit II [Beijerinckiaceae bacterium]|nr:cytochrome c oxidase subunit II [Beijerinckiaceae bacterium]
MGIERSGLRSAAGLLTAGAAMVLGGSAAMAGSVGIAEPWQLGMQEMVTELGRSVALFHDWLVILITLISLFVLALLVIIIVRFNEKANPVPTRTTHNTMLEVAWTIVPVLILVAIAIPSFRVLREQLIIPPHDVVVKATGHSWYWSYEYPSDQGGFRFESNMIPENERKTGQPRLLAVDNDMVVPVNKVVRVQVTAADVLHNYAMPAFGIRIDAVPGRLNETWFKADREGVYYGQCSELCGNGHPYMPITVRVVSDQQYAAWLAEAKQKFAATDGGVKLAAARH